MSSSKAINDPLVDELLRVHGEIAVRGNASYVTVKQSAVLGKDFFSAIASGLLTLGGLHAPLSQTCQFLRLDDCKPYMEIVLSTRGRVPGWGSSFVKGEPDPIFEQLDRMLVPYPIHARIQYVTGFLQGRELDIFPNASAYTSAVVVARGLQDPAAAYLLLKGRLDAWSAAFMKHENHLIR